MTRPKRNALTTIALFCGLGVLLGVGVSAANVAAKGSASGLMARPTQAPARAPTYTETKQRLSERREQLASRFAQVRPSAKQSQEIAEELTNEAVTLAEHWIGSSWGRGRPQSETPQSGKTNCGTFVGTLIRDIGFVVDIRKLQRQPSQGIIRSFVRGKRVRKFTDTAMETFLEELNKMGPGLYIIGLDLHVGLLIQTESEIRYAHSSSETGKVVVEPAADAWTIQSSGYRVVGKILSPRNIRDWLARRRIKVAGSY